MNNPRKEEVQRLCEQSEEEGGAMTVCEQSEERGGAMTVCEQSEEGGGAISVHLPCVKCVTSTHHAATVTAELTVRWTSQRHHHHHPRHRANRTVSEVCCVGSCVGVSIKS